MAFIEGRAQAIVPVAPGEEDADTGRRLGFDDDGRGGSPEVVLIYRKAGDLAQTLGHSTIEITHVLLAFTLTPDGIKRLSEQKIIKQKIDPAVVRRNCWMALAIQPSQPDARSPITFSSEVRTVNLAASAIAKTNDSNARSVQVSQVLAAMLDDRFKDHIAPLLAAVRPAPTPEEIRMNVEAVKHSLDGLVPVATQNAAVLVSLLKDVSGITIPETPETPRLPSVREVLQGKSDRIEKRLRNVKSVTLVNSALLLMNLIALLSLGAILLMK
jgi:hypothetical protein